MPTYEEEDAYASDTRTYNYSAGNHALLRQLAEDVREIRAAQKEQGRSISDLQVSLGKMETQVLALQTSGRAEAHIDGATLRQALWFALLLIVLLAVLLWIVRP